MSEEEYTKHRRKIYKLMMKSYGINDTLKLEYDERQGFYLVGNKNVTQEPFVIFQVPEENLLTWLSDFPFKTDIIEILSNVGTLKKKIESGNLNVLSTFLLATRVYVEIMIDIDDLKRKKKYGQINEIEHKLLQNEKELFKRKSKLNKFFLESFPRNIPVLKNWGEEELELFK